jgi:DNA-binding transcriptional MocR family regulator
MAETGFGSAVPAPVAAHDPEGRMVISLGSASKRYWGGLRIGWIRASEQRIAELGRLRAIFDMATPVLEQLAVTVMLERDCGADQRRALMRARCKRLIALLAEALPHWRTSMPDGGLALWVEMPHPEASALAAMVQSLGVRIAPGPRFAVEGAFERFVRLPFTLSESDLAHGVEQLARADKRLHHRAARDVESSLRAAEMERVI